MENKQVKQLIIYQAKNGAIEFRGDFKHDTIWGTQKQIAEVFDIDRSVVTKHIRNIFKDKELDKKLVCAKFAHTTFSSNSLSLKIFLICLDTTLLSISKTFVISLILAQIVSFPTDTFNSNSPLL